MKKKKKCLLGKERYQTSENGNIWTARFFVYLLYSKKDIFKVNRHLLAF